MEPRKFPRKPDTGDSAEDDEHLPSIYATDIPVGYTETDIRELHSENHLDAESLVVVKFLPRKVEGETFACLLKYADEDSMQHAVKALDGIPLETASGKVRHLGARPSGGRSQKQPAPHGASSPSNKASSQKQQGSRASAGHSALPASDDELPSAYVSDLPIVNTEDDLREFHAEGGLDPDSLVSVKFLPQKFAGETRSVILRYRDEASMLSAVEVLDGRAVETASGKSKYLGARPAAGSSRQEQVAGRTVLVRRHEPPDNSARSAAPQDGPPSAYVSDIPVALTEDDLRDFHVDGDLDPDILVEVKFLPQKVGGETRAAILRYNDEESMHSAVKVLDGKPVETASGKSKYLGARPAGGSSRHEQVYRHPPPQTRYWDEGPSQAIARSQPPPPNSRGASPHDEPPSAYVSDIPLKVNEDDLRGIHIEGDLDPDSLVSVKFLPQKVGGETRCAILRYDDEESMQRALQVLDGRQVETASGKSKYLGARPAGSRPAATSSRPDQVYIPPQRKFEEQRSQRASNGSAWWDYPPAPHSQEPPSVYISDVQVEHTEESLRELHRDLGIGGVVGVRFLPRKLANSQTCSVIVQYARLAAAHYAVERLHGLPITTAGGQSKYLGARLAEPASGSSSQTPARPPPGYYTAARPPHGGGMVYEPPRAPGLGYYADALPPLPAAKRRRVSNQDNSRGASSTALYVADLPVDMNDDQVWAMHGDMGLAPWQLVEIKRLPRKVAGDTCTAIFKYADLGSAEQALERLDGLPMSTRGGRDRYLGVKFYQGSSR